MTSYDSSDIYRKILALEDKVNRLEDILEYTKGGGYVSSSSYYEGGGGEPSYYKSAVRLSRATQNLKKDLLQNPRHSRLSRESYRQIYDRVSVLENELNNIIQNMNLQRNRRSDYNHYSNARSKSFYDVSPCMKGCDSHSNKRVLNRPKRKRITYDNYDDLIPTDSSSSESIEEIVYYIEPSSSSSSSSTIIVEEYIPKSYTRRSVKQAPIFDVSKSKPKPRQDKPPLKTKIRHHRRSAPEISVSHVRKSNKGKKKIRVEKSDSEASEPKGKSQLYLVKRSKESPKDIKKEKDREKYFVSRLKRVDSTDNRKNNAIKNKKKDSTEKSSSNKKYSNYEEEPSKHKGNMKQVKSEDNGSKVIQRNTSYKQKKVRRGPLPSQQSSETTTVAHSSFILNDPFVRTIYYDDFDSQGQENNTTLSSKNIKVTQNMSSEEVGAALTSINKMSNSIYTFDPSLKQKGKLYTKEKNNNFSLSQCSQNISYENQKSIIHSAKDNDIIALNNNEQKLHQQKLTFTQTKNSKNLEKPYLNNPKDKAYNRSVQALSPIAHSVFLATVPIYQDLQFPSQTQISSAKISQASSNSYKKPVYSEIPNQQRTNVEDEILLNLARKLSPIVAKIITANYSKSKEHLKPQSDSSMRPSYNNMCSVQSKVNQDSSLLVKDQQSKDKNKFYNNTKYNESITDSTNPNNAFRGPLNNLIYISKIEDDSPLVHKKPKKLKGVLKKSKTLSSVSNLLKKSNPRKSSKYLTEKKSGDSIQESIALQQLDSTMIPNPRNSKINQKHKRTSQIGKKPRSSQISQIPKRVSKVGQKPKTSTIQLKSNSKEDFEPKKSVSNKSKNQSINKKSVSRIKSMLNKMTTGEKLEKKKTEPTLISILSKMKTGDKNSKLLKKVQSLESVDSLDKVSHQTDLDQKQVSMSGIENIRQNSNQQILTQSSNQNIENEPDLQVNIEIYEGKSGNLQQSPSQAAQKQSKLDTRKDSISQEPTHQSGLISNLSPKSYTQGFDRKFSTKLKRYSRIKSVIGGDMSPDNIAVNPDAAFNNSGSNKVKKRSESEVGEERSEVIEPAINGLERSSHLKTNETPRNSQDLLYISPYNKKPYQFCVHFSKEKRTKYEAPSTLSLDNISSSQCKKIYSSEDISLSEYAFDEKTNSYRYRKIHPKGGKKFFKRNINFPLFPNGQDSNLYFNDFIKDIHSNSKCCCKTTRSIQLISQGSYVDWHKIANEIKQAK